MHQCINELSNSLRQTDTVRPASPALPKTDQTAKEERKKSVGSDHEPSVAVVNSQDITKNPASHFVTVIEVKETKHTEEAVAPSVAEEEKSSATTVQAEVSEKFVSAPLAAVLESKKKIPPR